LKRASRTEPLLCSTTTRICQTVAPFSAVAGMSPSTLSGPAPFCAGPTLFQVVGDLALTNFVASGFERVGIGRAIDVHRLVDAFLYDLDLVDARKQEIVLGCRERGTRVDDPVAGVSIDAGRSDIARGALNDRDHLAIGQARIP
jgi:hypothetical protein